MCKYSEFTFARNALPETIPGCAGFILGLPREEKLDRLVDLAEEFLIEHILLQLDPNRPPRIDYNQLDILLGWARDLIEWADYKESFSFKLEQEKGDSGWLLDPSNSLLALLKPPVSLLILPNP
uniref:Uncharacterized protein n=1 Tax=Meloidogyne javanica TaxID=6303 RepID=A0A915MZ54_MELJA